MFLRCNPFHYLNLNPRQCRLTSHYFYTNGCDLSLSPHATGHQHVSSVIINVWWFGCVLLISSSVHCHLQIVSVKRCFSNLWRHLTAGGKLCCLLMITAKAKAAAQHTGNRKLKKNRQTTPWQHYENDLQTANYNICYGAVEGAKIAGTPDNTMQSNTSLYVSCVYWRVEELLIKMVPFAANQSLQSAYVSSYMLSRATSAFVWLKYKTV